MKNQLMKLKKAEGFISIETVLVAGIVVLAGIVAYNVLYVGTLADKVTNARATMEVNTPDAAELFDMAI